jgi:peptide subunit release factor RF-3
VDESGGPSSVVTESMLPPSCRLLLDSSDRKVMLFDSEWIVKFFCERNPDVSLLNLPAAIKKA